MKPTICGEGRLEGWVGSLPSKPHKGYRSGYRSGYVQGIVLGPHRIHIFELRTAHASRGACFTSPVPGGLHLQKAAKTNRSTRVRRCALAEGCKNEQPQHAGISACITGPFFTCPRRCALAEGCKNEPQQAGISACITGSLLHLSPQVCTCRRLQKRTAARRCKIMHCRVRSSPVPGGVHLQKAAETNSSTRAFA